jgi:serine/threonine protein phosphatase PrpC
VISVDHCFEIGSSHTICEDYAMSGSIIKGSKSFYYGIVCDGCSSSKDVDVGARLLAYAAKQYIQSLHGDILNNYIDSDCPCMLALNILHNLKIIDTELLSHNGLDATLVLLLSDGLKARVYFFGDGGLVYTEDGIKKHIELSYDNNAPYYLSYELEENLARKSEYLAMSKDSKLRTKEYSHENGTLSLSKETWQDSNQWKSILFPILNTKNTIISIYSDGLFSFMENKHTPLSILDVVNRYGNFPIPKGEFVQRNFLFNKKVLLKDGYNHFDDISCASLSITSEGV